MRKLALIPARGGSKRIPKKNIKLFFGKPIISYAIECAINSHLFDEIMVSTDDLEIAKISESYGASVPFLRSEKNSDDYATTADVISEVLSYYEHNNRYFDAFCCLYPTTPLLNVKKIIDGYSTLQQYDSVISIIPFEHPIQRALSLENGVIQMISAENKMKRSQDFKKTYHDAGQFYWMWTKKFIDNPNFFTKNSGYIELQQNESQDINNEDDWGMAECKYMKLNKDSEIAFSNANKMILGTAQFGLTYGVNNKQGKLTTEMVKNILDYAYAKNINCLDTAEIYGDAHDIIGLYHRSSKNKFKILTKYGAQRNDLPKNISDRIYKNLEILGVDYLYGYMFHSFEDYQLLMDLYKKELVELRDRGILTRIGVSVYTNEEVEEVLKSDVVDLVQLPFNLLDNNNQRSIVLKKIKEKNIEIHTRSTFLQGLFFSKKLPGDLNSLLQYIEQLNFISKTNNISIQDLSLNYVVHQPDIDKVLMGVDSVKQLIENVSSLNTKLSNDIYKQIDKIQVKETHLLNPSNWNK